MLETANGSRSAPSQLLQATVQQQLQQLQRAQTSRPGSSGQTQQTQLSQQSQPKRAQNYQFTMTLQEILRKYARYPPSITFHIYETHYRFNNTQDSNIIPKESPMIKSFMKHLITEEIPPEIMELLRDLAIKFYDGCLIVQVYDHRAKKGENSVANKDAKPDCKGSQNFPTDSKGQDPKRPDPTKNPKSEGENKDKAQEPAAKPRKYRALLRPTPQSLYYDLLYHTDSALTRFTDLFALQMESELLTLTNRNLDLSVPLNPYLQHDYLHPEHEFPKVVIDKATKEERLLHSHRKETPREIRKLHEEQLTMHKSSEYEELMLLLSSKYSTSLDVTSDKRLVVVGPTLSLSNDPVSLEHTPLNSVTSDIKRSETSNAAPVIPSSNITSNQFMRLRFIEEIRKRKESQKAQTGAAMAAQAQNAFSSSQTRTGAIDSNGISAGLPGGTEAASRRMVSQQPAAIPARRDATPVHVLASQRMIGQQPQMSRLPLNVSQQGAQPQNAQGYNNMAQQASMVNRQGMPTHAQRSQAALRANHMQQPLMPQNISSATSPNYVGLPIGGNARLQPGNQRPMTQMQNQKPLPQAQMGRGQNMTMPKNANLQHNNNNMQERYLQQQSEYDPSGLSQTAKRQKLQQQNQFSVGGGGGTPQQMGGTTAGLMGNSIPNGNIPNGVMSNNRMASNGPVSSPQMGQTVTASSNLKNAPIPNHQNGQRPNTQPAGRNGQYSTQLQQQQIFQMMLSPQEQQLFRQMQSKVSALVQMGNTGLTPNRTRLTPEQQQRALQQGKALQQQMIQKFSNYFQKLRQLQILQQQRQQQMQRQQIPVQQNQVSDGSMYSQQGMNLNLPNMSEQVLSLPMMPQMNSGMQQGPGNQ